MISYKKESDILISKLWYKGHKQNDSRTTFCKELTKLAQVLRKEIKQLIPYLIYINSLLPKNLIYRLLNETKGSLLDDEQLVNTLQTSKITSQEVTEQLQISETTEVKIDAAREVRPLVPDYITNTLCKSY